MKNLRLVIIVLIPFLLNNCVTKLKEKGSSEYIEEIKKWHNRRIENLKKENGWLNLVGLYWLKQGENKFGSSSKNDIVFPAGEAPKFIGSFTLNGSNVRVKINKNIEVKSDGKIVEEMELISDEKGEPTILSYGSLRWFVIKRGEKFGIRLRDLEAPLVRSFTGIETFPINSDWRIIADFKKYDRPRKIEIPNILGSAEIDSTSGEVVFKKNNKTYSLIALDEGNLLFIIFGDKTNGEETYGGGRFLYANKPDSAGKVILDFNKAYNPPCVFTKYATCPLPPEQNHLDLEVTAGEKMFHGGAH
ncbi:DUF1684 domain-containing protein [Melioribacteraceae bacterium 4301-Me]|uniref:DUF1684 domain-containing protein n=1 Tax=Pyranulibacter aquaticus TaxID=3163344 RepID=UPI0035979372